MRELIKWIERCPCSFRGVACGKDTFASRMLSVAHDLVVEDPMDPMDAVEMTEGILPTYAFLFASTLSTYLSISLATMCLVWRSFAFL